MTPENIRKDAINSRQYNRAEEIVAELEGVTIGYIGNCHMGGRDDRSWYIFLAHPKRIGGSFDSLGGFSTENRGKLASIANALSIGVELGKHGVEGRADRALARHHKNAY